MFRVTHLCNTVSRNSFGLGAVIFSLAKSQLRQGYDARVWCLDTPAEIADQPESSGFPLDRVMMFPRLGPRSIGFSHRLFCGVEKESPGNDSVLHRHSVWTAVSAASKSWRSHRRGPTIVAPHGALGDLALRQSRWKKTLSLYAYERANLEGASCLHALSEAEAEAMRDFGLRNPIAVVPNGIAADWIATSGDSAAFRARHAIPPEKCVLLFLSRVTPGKGLPMFVESIRNVGRQFSGWLFVVAGPDEFRHERKVSELVDRYGLTESVKFVGPLFGKEKRDAFASADAFVLPSYSEGFPMVVLEALGAGIPVLTTTATPLPQLEGVGAGWRVQASTEHLTGALSDMLKTTKSVLREMGARGRRLVVEDFTWDVAGARLCSVYSWLTGREPRPSFVKPSL